MCGVEVRGLAQFFNGVIKLGSMMDGNEISHQTSASCVAPIRSQRTSAVALLSGGLDSTLAIKIIQEKGIDIVAVNFVSPFCLCNRKKGCPNIARYVGERLGVRVKTLPLAREYVALLRRPKHGYGRNLNPCIDCRILMFKKARRYMERTGASFIITGEVLGQRPMSQHRQAFRVIEREAGVEGLIVRPLSGRLLPPTEPEKRGLIKREWLLDIHGRSRRSQIGIAASRGIDYYPCPAGGCLLTDPSFAPRVRDLLEHTEKIGVNDLRLLKYGRHFRISQQTKAVVGRFEEENHMLERLALPCDVLFETLNDVGPVTLVRGPMGPDEVVTISQIHARYSDTDEGKPARILIRSKGSEESEVLCAEPASDAEIAGLRV